MGMPTDVSEIPWKEVEQNVWYECWFEYGNCKVEAQVRMGDNGAIGWFTRDGERYGTGVMRALRKLEL